MPLHLFLSFASSLPFNSYLLSVIRRGLLLPNHRQHRMRAIGQHILKTSPGYDIVGLQEVWAPQDFTLVREIVKDILPYAKHWTSGLFGSGLATFSKYPIVSSSLTRFALNGDPWPVWQGDWYDGKSCGSIVVAHPGVGEIEVFNTHVSVFLFFGTICLFHIHLLLLDMMFTFALNLTTFFS